MASKALAIDAIDVVEKYCDVCSKNVNQKVG
jgi:hypothetical protein